MGIVFLLVLLCAVCTCATVRREGRRRVLPTPKTHSLSGAAHRSRQGPGGAWYRRSCDTRKYLHLRRCSKNVFQAGVGIVTLPFSERTKQSRGKTSQGGNRLSRFCRGCATDTGRCWRSFACRYSLPRSPNPSVAGRTTSTRREKTLHK